MDIIDQHKLKFWIIPFVPIYIFFAFGIGGLLFAGIHKTIATGALMPAFESALYAAVFWLGAMVITYILTRLIWLISSTGSYAVTQAMHSVSAALFDLTLLAISTGILFKMLDIPLYTGPIGTDKPSMLGIVISLFHYLIEIQLRIRLIEAYPNLIEEKGRSFWLAIWRWLDQKISPERHPYLATRQVHDANDLPAYEARSPRYDFSRVQGMHNLKTRLNNAVHRFINETGNGILLYGPPGNGKTFIAEALAGKLQWRFLPVKVGELKSKWVNQTSEQIIALFQSARAQAPVVLFLDELDALLQNRSQDLNIHNEDHKAVNAFLTELTDINSGLSKHGVLVVGATNLLETLDPAAIREKRFDEKILVPPPDYKARLGIILGKLDRKHVKYDRDSLKALLKRWEGFSTARCIALADALVRTYRKRSKKLGYDDFIITLKQIQGTLHQLDHVPPLSQLALTDDIQRQVDLIIKMLTKPEAVESLGIRPAKGAIFHGPPGTGKTLLAKALAKTLRWSFLPVSGAELLRGRLTPSELIERAIDIKPVIVLIDEGDDLIRSRRLGGGSNAMLELLSKMEGDPRLQDVFFIATTNMSPDELDSAMIRDGRFEYLLDFTPDLQVLVQTARKTLEQRQRRNPRLKWRGDLSAYIAHAVNHLRPEQVEPTQSYIVGLIDDLLMQMLDTRAQGRSDLLIDFDRLLTQNHSQPK